MKRRLELLDHVTVLYGVRKGQVGIIIDLLHTTGSVRLKFEDGAERIFDCRDLRRVK